MNRPGITRPEIAENYRRSPVTVDRWCADPAWPAPIGKRGRRLEYDPEQVAAAVDRLEGRKPAPPAADVDADRLSTAEIAELYDITAGTARGYGSRRRFGQADDTGRYAAADVAAYMNGRRRYRSTRRRAPRTTGRPLSSRRLAELTRVSQSTAARAAIED